MRPTPGPQGQPQGQPQKLKPDRRVALAIEADLEIQYRKLEGAYKTLLELVDRPPETKAEQDIAMIACYVVTGELAARAHRRGDHSPKIVTPEAN